MRDTFEGITERLRLLRLSLQNLVDELGYQGISQQERDAASILGTLDYAIEHDSLSDLASVTRSWIDAQIVANANKQTDADEVPF